MLQRDQVSMQAVEPAGQSQQRLDDLAQIIRVYNEVTDRLQHSHEALRAQVVRLQQELASTNAQLHRSRRLAALGEMAAGIAHEIRNPLAAIQLYAGMLVEDLQQAARQPRQDQPLASEADLDQCAATAQKIARAVRGLNAVVTDVLTFAREIRPRLQPVTAAELFQRAIEANRPAIEAMNVRVDDQAVACDIVCQVDAELMHQALLNLIRNAVEAMAGRQTLAVISLAAQQEEQAVRLTIRDTGPGIADEAVDRIFNPFFTTRSTGNGLGLAIVHRIIDAHGGAITVQNDQGAVFDLRLPLSPRDDATAPAVAGVTV
jgi:signal transduction histidine kinase